MATGDKVDKNLKIGKFKTDVISSIMTLVEKDTSSAEIFPYLNKVPIVSKTSIAQIANNDGVTSIVETRSGQLTASALADLFMVYGRSLTACRRATVIRSRYRSLEKDSGVLLAPITTTLWSNKITSLSSEYAENATAFKAAVMALDANVFVDLGPGKVSQETKLDNLILRIRQAVTNLTTSRATLTFTVHSCHSACHSSCHSSRGRR